jgi:osmotically-inducible protein OsmY
MNLDDQITATIEAQLAVCEETRGQPIAVWTHAGVVRLSGRVPSEAVKDAANDVALAVPGVLQVLNGLLTGPDLARAVAQALAGDARTAGIAVDAAASDGEVTLRGWVHTAGEKEAAREVARTVPGVTTLLDELEVRAEGARRVGVWPEEASAAALASALGAPRRG